MQQRQARQILQTVHLLRAKAHRIQHLALTQQINQESMLRLHRIRRRLLPKEWRTPLLSQAHSLPCPRQTKARWWWLLSHICASWCGMGRGISALLGISRGLCATYTVDLDPESLRFALTLCSSQPISQTLLSTSVLWVRRSCLMRRAESSCAHLIAGVEKTRAVVLGPLKEMQVET